MPKPIRIKKGLDLNLIGEATGEIMQLQCDSKDYAIVPDDYPGLTPRLAVKEGDAVKSGDPVVFDKDCPEIVVASPIAGVIKKVVRGERRKILAIEIAGESASSHKTFDRQALESDIRKALLDSGLWAMLSQRPYGIIPSPETAPRDIFISAFDTAPLAPAGVSLYAKSRMEEFIKGVNALATLTEGKVYVGCPAGDEAAEALASANCEVVTFSGPHPAGNVGTQIAAVKPVNKGDVVWTVDPDVAARLGHLLLHGYVDYSCIVALTGEMVKKPGFYAAVAGIAIKEMLDGNIADGYKPRVVNGNVLTGSLAAADGYLRMPFRQLTVIPEIINDCEMIGWASLSTKKFSAGRTFFSWLMPKSKKYHFDAKINGGERAIIMAGEYDKVFPMDIFAEFLIKAVIARDIDKMEQLGIYEVVPEDFALCEFIDTSKLPLQKIVREGLDYLRKETN